MGLKGAGSDEPDDELACELDAVLVCESDEVFVSEAPPPQHENMIIEIIINTRILTLFIVIIV